MSNAAMDMGSKAAVTPAEQVRLDADDMLSCEMVPARRTLESHCLVLRQRSRRVPGLFRHADDLPLSVGSPPVRGNEHEPGGALSVIVTSLKKAMCAGMLLAAASTMSVADEGGVSFWLPGQMGSLAAVPADPGWSLATVYYHTSTDAGADKTFPRSGRITAGLDVTADLVFLVPSYVFTEPLLGGQAAVSVGSAFGRVKVDVDATLTGPGGNAFSLNQADSVTGAADLYPMGSLKWNRGAHNFMAYTMLGVPVGSYDVDDLANIGTNHWSADAGGGYTYLDTQKGHEFSAVLGFTYNFENNDTQYKNGMDGHLDWAASQFLSAQTHVGLVGYFYQQLTGDSGAGAVLGDFKSQVSAIGPQVGHIFPVGGRKWYVNLKGYYEFHARNRPEGWNTWVTLAIPLGAERK